MARGLNVPSHKQSTIRRDAVHVDAMHKYLSIPLHLPFRDELPVTPTGSRNTDTARSVWDGIGNFLPSWIDGVDRRGPGFAAGGVDLTMMLPSDWDGFPGRLVSIKMSSMCTDSG